jgi:hypothetical protein
MLVLKVLKDLHHKDRQVMLVLKVLKEMHPKELQVIKDL